MYLPQTQVQSLPCLVSHSVTPISCPLPNKTKLKLAQDFKDCRSLCFERKVLIESKYARLWVRCVFGNVLSESFLALSKNHFLVRCLEKKKYGGEEQVKRRGSRGSSWFPRWGVRHCDTGGHGQLPSRIKEQCKRYIHCTSALPNTIHKNIDSSLKRQLLHSEEKTTNCLMGPMQTWYKCTKHEKQRTLFRQAG